MLVSRIHRLRQARDRSHVRDEHRPGERDTAERQSSRTRPTQVATKDRNWEPFSYSVSRLKRIYVELKSAYELRFQ
jgi:hypothetical protein